MLNEKIRSFSIQPNLLRMLSVSEFDMDTLGEKPTAVFLIMPDEKTTYHRLVSLFIKQSYEYTIYSAQKQAGEDGFILGKMPVRVNYILDEFSSLPTIKDFPAMISAARSRNIRFNLIMQSKHQLLQRYDQEAWTIQSNCNNWIFLTSRELDFLQEISELCGEVTGQQKKSLLSVSDLQRLDKDKGEVLILSGRLNPCIARLPDIDEYDKGKFIPGKLPVREHIAAEPIMFDFLKESLLDMSEDFLKFLEEDLDDLDDLEWQ